DDEDADLRGEAPVALPGASVGRHDDRARRATGRGRGRLGSGESGFRALLLVRWSVRETAGADGVHGTVPPDPSPGAARPLLGALRGGGTGPCARLHAPVLELGRGKPRQCRGEGVRARAGPEDPDVPRRQRKRVPGDETAITALRRTREKFFPRTPMSAWPVPRRTRARRLWCRPRSTRSPSWKRKKSISPPALNKPSPVRSTTGSRSSWAPGPVAVAWRRAPTRRPRS